MAPQPRYDLDGWRDVYARAFAHAQCEVTPAMPVATGATPNRTEFLAFTHALCRPGRCPASARAGEENDHEQTR